MKPRSLVFNVYGDYVRYYGGEMGLQDVVALLGAFDVGEQTARVTLSRLKREGWLSARRVGRRSWYSLTPRSWRMLDEGRERIFKRQDSGWSGDWQLIIYHVPEAQRPTRERLRKALRWLGFGPLGPSTWITAHDHAKELAETLADRGIDAHYDLFTSQTGSLERDRAIAARCWQLDAIHEAYVEFMEAHTSQIERARAGELGDEECFVLRVRLVNEYRKFPFVDPDLPLELLPSQWAGLAAHKLFLTAYEALRAPAFRYYETYYDAPPSV